MTISLAAGFFAVYAGLDRGHGRHYPGYEANVEKGGKVDGGNETVHRPYTEELWAAHLAGQYSLGVIPIRDDGTVRFGAIDIDEYVDGDAALATLSARLVKMELPLVLTRTKSGGAHLWLFMAEDAPADLVRTKLMEWAVALGHSGVEVYPKQTRLASKEDYGNWINMPYFAGNFETNRYAVLANGKTLNATDFLALARGAAISVEELRGTRVEVFSADEADMWHEAPPCLQTLAVRGFGEGGRNVALFNIGVYLRKRYGDDDWKDRIDAYNSKYMDPPLPSAEVVKIQHSVEKKHYEYTSDQPPLVSVCNKQLCLSRKFGTGQGPRDPGVLFGRLVKRLTDPLTWFWEVNGARIELTTRELMAQPLFNQRAVEELNVWPTLLKPTQWNELVREKLAECDVQEVNTSETDAGIMFDYLQQYCLTSKAKSREELGVDKPWTDEGRTYFRAPHFITFLERNRVRVTMKKLTNWLRAYGDVNHHTFNIKGKCVSCWSVPAFPEQTEDYAIPDMPEEM